MAYECDSCRKGFTGKPNISITGRRLCEKCWAGVTGAAAGVIAGGGVGGAIATGGWFSRVRRARGKTRDQR